MKQLIIVLITSLLLTFKLEAQELNIFWRITPSFWNIYEIKIYKRKSK